MCFLWCLYTKFPDLFHSLRCAPGFKTEGWKWNGKYRTTSPPKSHRWSSRLWPQFRIAAWSHRDPTIRQPRPTSPIITLYRCRRWSFNNKCPRTILHISSSKIPTATDRLTKLQRLFPLWHLKSEECAIWNCIICCVYFIVFEKIMYLIRRKLYLSLNKVYLL